MFDGHGGKRVSYEASMRLLNSIMVTPEFQQLEGGRSSAAVNTDLIERAFKSGFLNLDRELRKVRG